MSTTPTAYGPPPHPARQTTRQLGPMATVALALAITIGLIAASGIIALLIGIGD